MDDQIAVKIDAARLSASPNVSAAAPEPHGLNSVASGSPNGIRSSPPPLAMDVDVRPEEGKERGESVESEAETVVLPGKDGHSPSKIRKAIKHEDRSDDEKPTTARDGVSRGHIKGAENLDVGVEMGTAGDSNATSSLGKRKRAKQGNDNSKMNGAGTSKDDTTHHGNSSGLSSAPTSPVATTRSSLSKPAASDSEVSKSPSPSPRSESQSRSRPSIRDKTKSVDRVLQRRKASESGEEEDGEAKRRDTQRAAVSGTKHSAQKRDLDADSHPRKSTRSVSPHSRGHRRSNSTQFPPKSSRGLSHKKKRVPAPLQSTEYHSDDSSASGTSHQRGSRVRHLAAPTTGESAMSPAKMVKKHLNPSGQTPFAVSCSKRNLEKAKKDYEERPEDLNVPDNALNTPLHVASLKNEVEIVKFLLGTGKCEIDCVNGVKDTPLHDAVDQGNVEIVKLLLDAGANPNKPNQAGNDPLDLLNEYELENIDEEMVEDVEEMKKAVIAAKERYTSRVPRDSEGPGMPDNISNPKVSPRQTTPITLAKGRTTARQFKTQESFLYQGHDRQTLRTAAQNGDAETVSRLLEVNPHMDDPPTLYNAARGGHDQVVSFCFALCENFNPDPKSVENAPSDQPTPILATIGKDHHLEVMKLILGHERFNPTNTFRGETYPEIARRRAGQNWVEEVSLLEAAAKKWSDTHTSPPGKIKSPTLRRDGGDARKRRDEASRSHKKLSSSPKAKDPETSKIQHRKTASLDQSREGAKRGPGRPKKGESTTSDALSDRETSPVAPPKAKSSRKSDSDIAVIMESEPVKRRKLVSGRELNNKSLDKQRRASTASTASGVSVREKQDRNTTESRLDKSEEKRNTSRGPKVSHSDMDRAQSIKREDSKDRLSVIRGESPVKRHRNSETPPRSGMQESGIGERTGEAPMKKRKLAPDSSLHKDTPSSSPEHRTSTAKSMLSRDNPGKSSDTNLKDTRVPKHGDSLHVSRDFSDKPSPNRRLSTSAPAEPLAKKPRVAIDRAPKASTDKPPSSSNAEDDEASKQARRKEREGAAARRKEAEEAEQERAEEAKQARLAREKTAREEEDKLAKEESARKEQQRRDESAARHKAAEEQRARFDQQEKEKKQRQEREREARAKQAQAERLRVEKERMEERLSKLPLLLRWFDQAPDPKTVEIAKAFKQIAGYRYDTITSESVDCDVGREQWMLNTHAAILLGEKDLQLSRYTAWERIPLSLPQKRGVWSTMNGLYSLSDSQFVDLRKQFPTNGQSMDDIIAQNRDLFLKLDLFFIKVTEFMFVVQNFPHLRGIEMEVKYKELRIPQTTSELGKPFNEMRWKQDFPNEPWSPLPTYYINGDKIRQGEVKTTLLSKQPPPMDRFPRREGITRVLPHESDYEEVCRKQGLLYLIPGFQASPRSAANPLPPHVNGISTPISDKSMNGGSPHRDSVSDPPIVEQLTNGTSNGNVSPMDTS